MTMVPPMPVVIAVATTVIRGCVVRVLDERAFGVVDDELVVVLGLSTATADHQERDQNGAKSVGDHVQKF